jgi:prevent-host-death family protein
VDVICAVAGPALLDLAKFPHYLSQMQAKTGELRNHLSRYLKRLAETGETLTILDRNRPVARIVPIRSKRRHVDTAWEKEKAGIMARALKLGIKIILPEKRPTPMRDILLPPPSVTVGRSVENAVVQMRREKDY